MKHTHSSQTYRRHRIPSHSQQNFASTMTILDLMRRHKNRFFFHHKRVLLALEHMERRV